MKPQVWAIVILAVTTAGCAVSDKSPSPPYLMETSTDRPHALAPAENAAPASADDAEQDANDDFDLLEQELADQTVEVADPLEPLNRIMYHVNDVLYLWVLEPCAKGCKAVTPQPVRIGIRNFFHNLGTPVRLVNCLLQGKADAAGTELHRFVLNTTTGVLGFGDPALDRCGLEPAEEDLGQTLATYGLDDGLYIVWPLFGPSTLRDSVGMAGDQFLNPMRYVEPTETSISISIVRGVNEGSFHIGEYEQFKSAALEPYVAMREAYIQYRETQIRQ